MPRDNLLQVRHSVENGIGILKLSGELIAESRYEPERILREWLEQGIDRVIIDCEKLMHVDSAGISTLLGALHRYRRQDGDLALAQLAPKLGEFFKRTGMERFFRISADLDAARAHYRHLEMEKARAKVRTKAGQRPPRPEAAAPPAPAPVATEKPAPKPVAPAKAPKPAVKAKPIVKAKPVAKPKPAAKPKRAAPAPQPARKRPTAAKATARKSAAQPRAKKAPAKRRR